MAQLESDSDQDALPFVAPCRQVDLADPVQWFILGWQDFKRAPRISLIYGFSLVVLCYAVVYLTWNLGGFVLILSYCPGLSLSLRCWRWVYIQSVVSCRRG